METQDRAAALALIDRLAEAAWEFDFFRAVRLLEALHPDQDRVGASLLPKDDPVRFGQRPSLAFPPSTLEGFERPGPKDAAGRLFVRFLGLFGPNSPLPHHFTEHAQAEVDKDGHPTTALSDFCDIFHHRLLSLFYRAWALNQKTADFDRLISHASSPARTRRSPGKWDGPRFSLYIGSAFGLGTEAVRDKDAVPDVAKLFFAGRLACPTRPAEGLRAILREYLSVLVRIETFSGHWLDLTPEHSPEALRMLGQSPRTGQARQRQDEAIESGLCLLGLSRHTSTLGKTVILDSVVWDCQSKFRVRLGPMSLADYKRQLPGGPRLDGRAYRHLKTWVLNYAGEELFWDVQLVLRAEDVPGIQLDEDGFLGWTTWLRDEDERLSEDVGDLILDPTVDQ